MDAARQAELHAFKHPVAPVSKPKGGAPLKGRGNGGTVVN
jgi:hypothetical protein